MLFFKFKEHYMFVEIIIQLNILFYYSYFLLLALSIEKIVDERTPTTIAFLLEKC